MSLLLKTEKWLMKATVADVKKVLSDALAIREAQRPQTSIYLSQMEMLQYLGGASNQWPHADNKKWKNVYEEAYGECSSYKLALLLAVDNMMAQNTTC